MEMTRTYAEEAIRDEARSRNQTSGTFSTTVPGATGQCYLTGTLNSDGTVTITKATDADGNNVQLV